MKFNLRSIVYSVGLFLLISCGPQSTDIHQFISSGIILPTSLRSPGSLPIIPDTIHPKIVIYHNAEVCSSCKVKELFRWQGRLMELDSLFSENRRVMYFYIFHTSNDAKQNQINETLASYPGSLPVFLDPTGDFERLNPGLPANPIFHTFLLDRNNRVVLVGSPIGNPKMWTLYKQTIAKLAANDGQLPDSP